MDTSSPSLILLVFEEAMSELHVKPGEVILIAEISYHEASVRVAGRCSAVRPLDHTIELEHRGSKVTVNTELVPDQAFRLNEIYQVIGETVPSVEQPNSVVLKARVTRWVPDTDLDLYEQAVRIRRAFLGSLTVR